MQLCIAHVESFKVERDLGQVLRSGARRSRAKYQRAFDLLKQASPMPCPLSNAAKNGKIRGTAAKCICLLRPIAEWHAAALLLDRTLLRSRT